MKKVFKIIVALVVMLLIALLVVWNLPKDSSKRKEAAHQITATELFTEFSTDEQKANNKFLGKTIEVKGKIAAIETDEQGAVVVILRTEDPIAGVLCTLEAGEEKAIPDNTVGTDISVKGLCTGMLMDVVLNKCVIVN